jgi:hypothetical protein
MNSNAAAEAGLQNPRRNGASAYGVVRPSAANLSMVHDMLMRPSQGELHGALPKEQRNENAANMAAMLTQQKPKTNSHMQVQKAPLVNRPRLGDAQD